MPRVTYIVSAFNRPASLPCCLWSLKVQTDSDFEVIVADNSTREGEQLRHAVAVRQLNDLRFRHVNTAQHATVPPWDCYWAAEWVIEHEARGEWLCFPSDDSYYVPIFQEALLDAANGNGWKFVYCDMLYDRRLSGRYERMDVSPVPSAIDKTGFLIHREAFIGFPWKWTEGETRGASCDGYLAAEVVGRKLPHGKVNEVLCVHN
jgi:hypothetical protein